MRVIASAIALVLAVALGATGCEDARSPVEAAAEWFPPSQRATARCIIWYESRNDPGATGRYGERGLFQIHPVHRRSYEAMTGKPWSTVYQPILNGQMARAVWDAAGGSWRPWTTASRCT